jgi:thioredoxin-like negative regulator of GroEL
MILWFTTPTCQPCKRMAPIMETLMDEGYVIEKINAQDHPDDAADMNVTAVPTLIKIHKGVEVDRHVGALNEIGLRKFIA